MTLPTYSELYLGLAKIVSKVDTSIPILLKGMPFPNLDEVPDFIAFDLLNEVERRTQSLDGDRIYSVQLSCHSLHAEYRADKKFSAPYDLAYKYKPFLHRATHIIKSSCFRTLDAKITYLDLRSTGDYSKQIYQTSPSLKIHTCVIHTTAQIS